MEHEAGSDSSGSRTPAASGRDRRQFQRKELFTSSVLQPLGAPDPVANHGITKDISAGGVCVSLYNTLEEHLRDKDAVYKVQLRLPHMAEPLHIECRLAWVKKLVHTIQVALVFVNLNPTDLQAIQAYCS